jgi:hypothetical protein
MLDRIGIGTVIRFCDRKVLESLSIRFFLQDRSLSGNNEITLSIFDFPLWVRRAALREERRTVKANNIHQSK